MGILEKMLQTLESILETLITLLAVNRGIWTAMSSNADDIASIKADEDAETTDIASIKASEAASQATLQTLNANIAALDAKVQNAQTPEDLTALKAESAALKQAADEAVASSTATGASVTATEAGVEQMLDKPGGPASSDSSTPT